MRTAIDDWHSLANLKRKIDTPVSVSAERIIELDDEIQRLREALFELSEFSPPDNSCIHVTREAGHVFVYYTISHDSEHYSIYNSLNVAAPAAGAKE